MFDRTAQKLAIVGLTVLLALLLPIKSAYAQTTETQEQNANALEITKKARNFELHADKFHLQAAQQAKHARKLRGQAVRLRHAVHIPTLQERAAAQSRLEKARAAKLQAEEARRVHQGLAIKQYEQHASEFQLHIDQYKAHLDEFRARVGECKDGEAAYADTSLANKQHVERYHIPGLARPHVCPPMMRAVQSADGASRQMVQDMQELSSAERALYKQEQKLAKATSERLEKSKEALKQAGRNDLAEKLGHALEQEYDQLSEEHQLLQLERSALPAQAKKP